MRRLLSVFLAIPWAGLALGQAAPCDDVTYARDTRLRYPQAIDSVVADEARRRTAWNARWDAISARIVAARMATVEGQSAYRLALWRRADVAALDARIAAAETDFRERNIALTGAPVIARLDPLRPERAACLLSQSALEALAHKLDLENQQAMTIDQALLEEAARLGVSVAP